MKQLSEEDNNTELFDVPITMLTCPVQNEKVMRKPESSFYFFLNSQQKADSLMTSMMELADKFINIKWVFFLR